MALLYGINNRKAQALIELAIFGTVLLFVLGYMLRFGMGATYKQNIMQRSFRKAFARASEGGVSNRWRNVNYTVLEDKPIISTQGLLPVAERVTVGNTVSATRSMDMYGQMVYGDNEHMPRTEFEINGTRYSFPSGAFVAYQEHPAMRKKQTKVNWDGLGAYWEWITVDTASEGDAVDVDGDGYEEIVMEKSGTTLLCIDYQEGEINTAQKINGIGREPGGLDRDYDKELIVANSSLERQEDATRIVNIQEFDIHEKINRDFTTKSDGIYGGLLEIQDDLSIQKTVIWDTPK